MSSQNTSGTEDDDLFEDAITELTTEINTHLTNAHTELPDTAEIWDVDAPNILGALNTLRGELDITTARTELREARKKYVLADRADAFDDTDTLGDEIQSLSEVIDALETTREQVADLTNTIPDVKQRLDETTPESLSDTTDDNSTQPHSESESEPDDTDVSQTDSDTTDNTDDTQSDDEPNEPVPIHSPPTSD